MLSKTFQIGNSFHLGDFSLINSNCRFTLEVWGQKSQSPICHFFFFFEQPASSDQTCKVLKFHQFPDWEKAWFNILISAVLEGRYKKVSHALRLCPYNKSDVESTADVLLCGRFYRDPSTNIHSLPIYFMWKWSDQAESTSQDITAPSKISQNISAALASEIRIFLSKSFFSGHAS